MLSTKPDCPSVPALFSLTGKAAVVTGAAGGLGGAIVSGLRAAGAIVTGIDIKGPPSPLPDGVQWLQVDVSVQDQLTAAIDRVHETHGRLDILVSNAAIAGGSRAEQETGSGFDSVMAVNVKGPLYGAQAAMIHMKRQGGGSIINVASVLSFVGYPGAIAYTASKGAILQMTRTMAVEWGGHNIRVNAIAPGFFRTPMNEGFLDSPDRMQPIYSKIPLSSIGEPPDIVGAVIYFASDASRFATGSCLVVDGGEMAACGYTESIFPFVYEEL